MTSKQEISKAILLLTRSSQNCSSVCWKDMLKGSPCLNWNKINKREMELYAECRKSLEVFFKDKRNNNIYKKFNRMLADCLGNENWVTFDVLTKVTARFLYAIHTYEDTEEMVGYSKKLRLVMKMKGIDQLESVDALFS